jgi:uracil-DNA glycosylase
LVNILREVHDDVHTYSDDFGEWLAEQAEFITDLERWAKQGVLLINTAHTVAKGVPGSHTALWKLFTKRVLDALMIEHDTPIVFILWGRHAQRIFYDQVGTYPITNGLVIESAHPSPFSAHMGFFGSKPFSKTNKFLAKNNVKPIVW